MVGHPNAPDDWRMHRCLLFFGLLDRIPLLYFLKVLAFKVGTLLAAACAPFLKLGNLAVKRSALVRDFGAGRSGSLGDFVSGHFHIVSLIGVTFLFLYILHEEVTATQ